MTSQTVEKRNMQRNKATPLDTCVDSCAFFCIENIIASHNIYVCLKRYPMLREWLQKRKH